MQAAPSLTAPFGVTGDRLEVLAAFVKSVPEHSRARYIATFQRLAGIRRAIATIMHAEEALSALVCGDLAEHRRRLRRLLASCDGDRELTHLAASRLQQLMDSELFAVLVGTSCHYPDMLDELRRRVAHDLASAAI